MLLRPSIARAWRTGMFLAMGFASWNYAQAQSAGDPAQGKIFFQTNCALCHSDGTGAGAGSATVVKQGPSLVGVVGRKAGTMANFNYTQAMSQSGLVWDAPTLDRYLTKPTAAVPGTTMPIAVVSPLDRSNVIAYLSTLQAPAASATPAPAAPAPPAAPANPIFDSSNWNNEAPGVKHHITVADLPAPFATHSAGNGPKVVPRPDGANLSVPPGFTVKQFASGLQNPRIIHVAPNGDIFIAETGPGRIRVLRAADGAEAPTDNQVFVDGQDHPFGMAFYPPGDNSQWIYLANNNAVVRFPYHNGDLHASGPAEVIVPKLTDSHGGHSTRDVAFSKDGKRMFISVGSASNVAEGMSKKSPDDIKLWEKDHGFGAAWDGETNRADILVTDPEGKEPLRTFATGIRNGVGIAVNESTGDLWTSTNERDGLGDDLVPDYITSVKEGGYYGWPWYYLGNNEDPRLKGDRPDLAGKAIVPDVLLQAHSASLGMCFYNATQGGALFPKEYQGNAFASEHGSWNRTTRTGYKVIRVIVNNGVPTGEYEDFLTGFGVDDKSVWGRPVGVAVAHDGALLVTEDGAGTVWRIAPTGH